jgi:nucleotide-binding universal stress UspA family protein
MMRLRTVAHATDFSDDDPGFFHALVIASEAGAKLVSVHAHDGRSPAHPFEASALVAKWGRRAVEHSVKVHTCCDDPADTVLDALLELSPDFLVESTHARKGLRRLLAGSVAEDVARNVTCPTLICPTSAKGFVDPKTGALTLQRIMLPCTQGRDTQRAVDVAVGFARTLGADVELLLVHVGEGRPEPRIETGVRSSHHALEGVVDDSLARFAREQRPDLIVMATRGHDDLGDVALGSHTERLLHEALCPVLVLPV